MPQTSVFFSDNLNSFTNIAMHFPVSWDDRSLRQDGSLKTLYARYKSKNDLKNDLLKFTEAIPPRDSDDSNSHSSGPEALNALRSNQTFVSRSQDLSIDLVLFMY